MSTSSWTSRFFLIFLLLLLLLPSHSWQQAALIRYVNVTDLTCQSLSPCYQKIQAAIDAAQPGDTVRVQAGEYDEALTIKKKQDLILEADPAAPEGSVMLDSVSQRCFRGDVLTLIASANITIRGFTITDAGGQAIDIKGGGPKRHNDHIIIERNRLFGNGTPQCQGGIRVGANTPDTVILNNFIYGNGQDAIRFLGGKGGPHYVVQNVIHGNRRNGINVTKGQTVVIANNLITHNGTDPKPLKQLFGIRRPAPKQKSRSENAQLLYNLICGNSQGELFGRMLDGLDAGNLTPTGLEDEGTGSTSVAASPQCADLHVVYADVTGPDGQPNTKDDDFTLAVGSPGVDAGTDPRLQGLPIPNANLEQDFFRDAIRPGGAAFDIGAIEGTDPRCTPGATESCYSGPGGTQGVGICRAGTRTCQANGTFGPCQGEVLPQEAESCNGLDDDCDAQTDEGFGQQTCGIGACQRTVSTCENGQPQVCTPGAPIAEICGNTVDDDCDGQVDELDACPVNQPPAITSAPVTTAAEGQAYSYDVSATDPDTGDTLTFSLTVAPFGMTIDPTTGGIQWTPEVVQAGEQAVTVQVRDNGGLFSRQSFSVQVAEANRAPTAVDDHYEAEVGQTLSVPAHGILTNDTDPNQGNMLTATLVSPPSNGDLSLNANGSFAYTPKSGVEPTTVQVNLTRLIPGVTAIASSSFDSNFPPSRVIDDNLNTSWFTAIGDAANLGTTPFLDILFPQDVTVTELQMFGNRQFPTGFDFFAGVFQLFDASGAVLFDSGVVNLPAPDRDVTVSIPNIAGVRRVRFTATADESTEPGFAELKVIGQRIVPKLDPVLKWQWTGSPVLPDFKQVISTPIVANLTDDNQDGRVNQDDIPDVLFVTTDSLSGGVCGAEGVLRAVSGADGSPLFDVTDPALRIIACSSVAVGDLDGDQLPEIVGFQPNQARLVILKHDGTLKQFSSSIFGAGLSVISAPSIADLNHDGTPEIIIASTVLSNTGLKLFTADFGTLGPISTAADLDLSGALEIVAGFQAYRSDGSVFYNLSGSGYPAIGNFDDDPNPEVVVVSAGSVFLLEHDGTLKWGPKTIPGGGAGGPPTVADFDGDGEPEIGVAGSTRYAVFETNGDLKWQATTQDGSSQITGSSVFDFDNDGNAEVVYNDELKLRILDGKTGLVVFETPNTSCTAIENPVVVDVDNDGHAEIVVGRNNICGFGTQQGLTEFGIFVYGGRNNDWVRTRRIWNQHAYHITNVNEDGTIPQNEQPNWLTPGLNNFRTNAFGPGDDRADKFVYKATDGNLDSNEATVFITVRQPNAPPEIISTPLTTATVGLPYFHAVRAIDPDLGDELTFALIAAPAGMTIDPATGLLRWTPTNGQLGGNNVTVRVEDRGGLTDFQIFTVQASAPVTVPNVVGQAQATAESAIGAAGLTVGVTSAASSPTVPAGQVMSQNPAAGTSVAPGSAVNLVISTGPPPPGLTLVSVSISPTDPSILTADTQAFTATGIFGDGSSQNLTDQVVWESTDTGIATIASTGVATGIAQGTTTVRAGKDGIVGTATLTVRQRIADATPPTAEITSPASNSTLTAPTDIIGTATDANFSSYTLEIAPAGETTFTLLTTGSTPVTNGKLGTLDPTVLLNDLYTVRLTVFDLGGNTATAEVTVQVAREQKVGLFTVTFQDLSVAVSGLPITINRTYDSRDKRKGDFGVGWRLDVQTMRVRANRVQGTGWQVNKSGLNFLLVSADQHKISLTLPDGRVEEFDLQITPSASFLLPLQTVTASYAPRPGTLGTLIPLDNPNLVIFDNQPGPVELLDDLTFNLYNPQTFRYTSVDGREFVINKITGVQSVRDLNGNTLTFGVNGIIHSAGKSIAFTRDAQGRITQIADPEGHFYQYAYDANGDLVSYTDAVGNLTRFFYNRRHDLIRIVDPLGRPVARNEYDDNGRLIAATSANGGRITFAHDLNTRQEVLTDVDGNLTVLEYDVRGNVIRATDSLGEVTTNSYDTAGNQLTTTNPLGETIARTFDARRNVLSQTNAVGETTTFTYNSRDQLLSVTNPLGHITSFTYDSRGNLLSRVNGVGITEETNTYDTQGNLLTRTDGVGGVTQFTYDAFGNLMAQLDPRGNRQEFTYDAQGNLLSEKDRRGGSITTTYDARRLFTQKRDPLGNVATFTYDAVSNLTAVTDAAGNHSERTVDAEGRDLTYRDPVGNTSTRAYDAKGNLSRLTNPAGESTQFEYDALDRRTKVILPDGAFETFMYDAAGRNTARTDANGNTTNFAYDAAGRLIRTTDALGGITRFEYDAAGNQIKQIDALGNEFTFTYDGANRQIGVTFPDGSSTSVSYDGAGRKASETDAAGHTTRFEYDGNGNLAKVIDAAGGETTFTYDPDNNLLTQVDANGHTTSYAYDANGRRVQATLPAGQSELYQYDLAGNVFRTTTRKGDVIFDEFDATQRQTARIYPDGGRIQFSYTGTGKVSTATDSRGTTSYSYDSRDRVVRIANPDGSSLVYTYDAVGNRTSVATRTTESASPRTTTYTYDALNRLVSVTDPSGRVSAYTYDAIGNLKSVQYPNGTTTLFTYNALSRLTVLEHKRGATVLDRFIYTVNAVGDRTRVDALDGSFVTYSYDALRRLTQETRRDTGGSVVYDVVYTYDAGGNRLTHALNSGTAVAYVYDVNDRLLSLGGVTFAYDANGNTTSRTQSGQTTTYEYDFEDRLTRTVPPGGATTTYAYDTQGNRVRKSGTGGAVNYLVDPINQTGVSQVLEEYGDSGDQLASYVYGNQLLGQERGGQSSFYHRDGTNSTRLLTDGGGAVTDRYTFDAFGQPLAQAGATLNPYLFVSEQLDPESGLYYLRARYYSPETGRFFSVDPFAGFQTDPVSLHRYLYARANPVSFVDPSGLQFTLTSLVVSFSINATISAAISFRQGKSAGQIVTEALVSGVLGAAGGGLGALASKGLVGGLSKVVAGQAGLASKAASIFLKAPSLILIGGIAFTKASISTVAFALEQRITDGPNARPNLVGYFMLNFFAETILATITVNKGFSAGADQAKTKLRDLLAQSDPVKNFDIQRLANLELRNIDSLQQIGIADLLTNGSLFNLAPRTVKEIGQATLEAIGVSPPGMAQAFEGVLELAEELFK
jgi:RHS repeat-associated protein